MAERRELNRIPLDAEVTLRDPRSERVYRGTVKNIHLRGIAIACETKPARGDDLEIEVIGGPDREAGTGPLVAKMRVLRVGQLGPPFEVAGEFVELDLP